MANTTMMFPNTVREFMEQHKMVDTEQIYSNGIEYVPIFRMEQWFDHIEGTPSAERYGRWEDVEHAPNGLLYATCSVCGKRQTIESVNYCGNCGAKMVEK